VNTILADKDALAELQSNPEKVLKETEKTILAGIPDINEIAKSDPWIWRMVIGALLLGVVITTISLGALAYYGKNQEGLLSIGTASVAALAGLLAPSPVKTQ